MPFRFSKEKKNEITKWHKPATIIRTFMDTMVHLSFYIHVGYVFETDLRHCVILILTAIIKNHCSKRISNVAKIYVLI